MSPVPSRLTATRSPSARSPAWAWCVVVTVAPAPTHTPPQCYDRLMAHSPSLLFGCFLLTRAAIGFGPAITTVVLPVQLFPASIRSTCVGLAAAFAKFGALLSACGAPYLLERQGHGTALLIASVCPAAALVVMRFGLPQRGAGSTTTTSSRGRRRRTGFHDDLAAAHALGFLTEAEAVPLVGATGGEFDRAQ